MDIILGSIELFDPDHLTALVAPAVRTHLVRRLRLEARSAQASAGGLQRMVGAAHVAARPRNFAFWIGHLQTPFNFEFNLG